MITELILLAVIAVLVALQVWEQTNHRRIQSDLMDRVMTTDYGSYAAHRAAARQTGAPTLADATIDQVAEELRERGIDVPEQGLEVS
jgi:hypothetical protein